MTVSANEPSGRAWYAADRTSFVEVAQGRVVAELSSAASAQGWHIEPQQHQEWDASVGLLQGEMRQHAQNKVSILREALDQAGATAYSDVILEYDFRRRGLRIDCVLLAPGMIAVVEFKRSALTPSDVDQVMNYCVNLVEFHEETQRLVTECGVIVVPILVQTRGRSDQDREVVPEFHSAPWASVLRTPFFCDADTLGACLEAALGLARSNLRPDRREWLASRFSPSSSILDAAISLFGEHEVSAIRAHASPLAKIEETVTAVSSWIDDSFTTRRNRIILVSGSPGAGKTLVGLRIVFSESFRSDAVFVTGNAPLVDVLTSALKRSYREQASRSSFDLAGYPKESARTVVQNSLFKLVKAHAFLGERGEKTNSSDGRLVIFDEAQRTYEKGRTVLGSKLADHEADLILASLEESYEPGCVVVALLGHNQAINKGERGAIAWLEAADRRGWDFVVSDETLNQSDSHDLAAWRDHSARLSLSTGHLADSLRFYRNAALESWAGCVLDGDSEQARAISEELSGHGHDIWMTRDLETAKKWVRDRRVGDERAGIIASGQARRLAAEGLFVDLKPDIANWMLTPSGDVRSSNMLETVQNQYQIQGLELDYTIVCWDADLRRSDEAWSSWKMHGANWQRDKGIEVAKNGYRVLLTRARKGMILFVPRGDASGEDLTRDSRFYESVAKFLVRCGASPL